MPLQAPDEPELAERGADAPAATDPVGAGVAAHATPEHGEDARPSAPATPGLTMFELARVEEARRRAAEVEAQVRASAATVPKARRPRTWLTGLAAVTAVGAVLAAFNPSEPPPATPADLAALRARARAGAASAPGGDRSATDGVRAASPGYGKSGDVLVRVAMPGQLLESPVSLPSGIDRVPYAWVRAADSSEAAAPGVLRAGSAVVAPARPGLYRLAVGEGRDRRVVGDLTVAVLVPFAQKLGGTVNGYRLGSWPFERLGGERPLGFVEVTRQTADLAVSRHLKLRDFVTRDGQAQWPRYVVVSPRLLDKLELIVDEIVRLRGIRDQMRVAVDVHSGFRSPSHNSGVEGSALNSRHQYGDAADVAIDADGDGRFTGLDSRVVAMAAEMVERRHPELTGGLGLYVNAASPFVHVDARGRRARWWR